MLGSVRQEKITSEDDDCCLGDPLWLWHHLSLSPVPSHCPPLPIHSEHLFIRGTGWALRFTRLVSLCLCVFLPISSPSWSSWWQVQRIQFSCHFWDSLLGLWSTMDIQRPVCILMLWFTAWFFPFLFDSFVNSVSTSTYHCLQRTCHTEIIAWILLNEISKIWMSV